MADAGMFADLSVIVVTVIIGVTVLLFFYVSNLVRKSGREKEKSEEDVAATIEESHKTDASASGVSKSKKKTSEKWRGDSKQTFSNPWLITTLKGHSGQINDMDFSANNKYLATCAEDRTVLLWTCKDFQQKEHRSVRANVDYDHATHVCWSPDSKAIIVHKATENLIEVYKVGKKPEGGLGNISVALSFPKLHISEIVGMGIACTGRFIMSCSDVNELVLWDLKGQKLAQVDTYLMSTTRAKVSPCGRFVAAAGFAPDVKVWEVRFTKTGEFDKVTRAFELKGHSSGVLDFAFSGDSSRMASASKDKTWKLFDTKIEYEKGEEPHLVVSGHYDYDGISPVNIALSPDGRVVALSLHTTLYLYSGVSGNLETTIKDVFTGSIKCVLFDPLGKQILVAGDKHVRVFHNVVGYQVTIADLEEKKKSSVTSAQRDRMNQQIKEAQAVLKEILLKT